MKTKKKVIWILHFYFNFLYRVEEKSKSKAGKKAKQN